MTPPTHPMTGEDAESARMEETTWRDFRVSFMV